MNTLPDSIGSLAALQVLALARNNLSMLPDSLGNLMALQTLDLGSNNLSTLPEALGNLAALRTLNLDRNNLSSLPDSLGNLTALQKLQLAGNNLSILPDSLGSLTALTYLGLSGNQFSMQPGSFTSLVACIDNLASLEHLQLDGNPLPDRLFELQASGFETLLGYLRSLKGSAEPTKEAKLVLVGEGGVGKTSLLDALRNQPFVENRATTHGIEVQVSALQLEHPSLAESAAPLTLNAWDFGGQQVYQITHQFFFTDQALYLVLWNPRLGIDACDVEGWLRRIVLRVGNEARIIVVATHCQTGSRVPRIDKTRLEREFGDVLVGFNEIDSRNNAGIPELREKIANESARLSEKALPLSPRWKAVRKAVQEKSRTVPRITFAEFVEMSAEHDVGESEARILATLLNILGSVVYFDEESLREELILQPQWIAKAIGYVLEDRATNAALGLLQHEWLGRIWAGDGKEERESYEPNLHPFFLRLMEKFDVSYRLEGGKESLVPQLLPHERPELPWEPEDSVASDDLELKQVVGLDVTPPGLVPWLRRPTHRASANRFCAS